MIKDLIDLVGWRNAVKGIVEGVILTGYIPAVYLEICAIIPVG